MSVKKFCDMCGKELTFKFYEVDENEAWKISDSKVDKKNIYERTILICPKCYPSLFDMVIRWCKK